MLGVRVAYACTSGRVLACRAVAAGSCRVRRRLPPMGTSAGRGLCRQLGLIRPLDQSATTSQHMVLTTRQRLPRPLRSIRLVMIIAANPVRLSCTQVPSELSSPSNPRPFQPRPSIQAASSHAQRLFLVGPTLHRAAMTGLPTSPALVTVGVRRSVRHHHCRRRILRLRHAHPRLHD